MIRKTLGRGLDALFDGAVSEGSETAALAAADANRLRDAAPQELALDRIVPSPFQPRRRFDGERLSELAAAIRAQGVVEPLVVRRASQEHGFDGAPIYELIAGERRLRAAREAGLERVPVVVREVDDRTALEISLVENLIREDLSPVDEAAALSRLCSEFRLTQEQVAQRIGKSRPYVSNAIRLLELAPAVLEAVARGELTAGQARPLLALPTAEAQAAAAREIIDGRISARGAEQIAAQGRRKGRASRAGGAGGRVDPNLAALADRMQRALKRKVRIVARRGSSPGRVEIEYYGDADLTALADTLGAAGRAA